MDMATYLRFALALVFVLALIAALAWAVRRFGLAGAIGTRRPGGRRRLALVETMAVDAKRRLILVRRDDVEHLVMVGGEHDLLIEGGIPAGAAAPEPGQGSSRAPAAPVPDAPMAPDPQLRRGEGPLARLRATVSPGGPRLGTADARADAPRQSEGRAS